MRYLYVKYGDNDYGYSARLALMDLFRESCEYRLKRRYAAYHYDHNDMLSPNVIVDNLKSERASKVITQLNNDGRLIPLIRNFMNLHNAMLTMTDIISRVDQLSALNAVEYPSEEMIKDITDFDSYFSNSIKVEFHDDLQFLAGDGWHDGDDCVLDMCTGHVRFP